MIQLEDQANLFEAISKKLKRPITVYAIGGTAMMLHGLKDATLDIDLVFKNKEDKEEFKRALKEIGYRDKDAVKVYGIKRNTPDMLTLGNERFDLFVDRVIDFIFSDNMRKRSSKTYEFGKNFILKIADYHDIIIMKCATNRTKDMDDIKTIVESKKIEWSVLVDEAKNQINLGEEGAVMDLGNCLEDLKKNYEIKIPNEILDELWAIMEKQIKEKQNKLKE